MIEIKKKLMDSSIIWIILYVVFSFVGEQSLGKMLFRLLFYIIGYTIFNYRDIKTLINARQDN